MRITKITVKKLFGIFDHEIPLNQESRITMMHGPNGFGKTILLTMIHGLFNGKYRAFYEIPFDSFSVQFDSQQIITVRKENTAAAEAEDGDESAYINPSHSNGSLLLIELTSELSEEQKISYELNSIEHYRRRFYDEVDSIPGLRQMEEGLWINRSNGLILTMDEILETYEDLRSKLYDEPKWFARIRSEVHIRFIDTQRLQSQIIPEPFRSVFGARDVPAISSFTVVKFSNDIRNRISDTRTRYGEVSQVKDRSFPKRLMEASASRTFQRKALQRRLEKFESKRSELMKLGLLDKDDDVPNIPALDTADDYLSNALSIYVEDIEYKLAVFDDIYSRLKVLTEIVNDRFNYKTLTINQQDGFTFVSSDGSTIPLENLSSGEQHALVVYYELLFQGSANSLILIDEPDMSLHGTWQRKFLSDIQRITELDTFDVLLATHSSEMGRGQFELLVSLNHPERRSGDEIVRRIR